MRKLVKTRAGRVLFIAIGWLFVGIGFVGLFLPLIPTTGPVLLASFLFSISSERFDRWLLSHRIFGPLVSDWRAGRGLTARSKATAVVAIVLTFTITVGLVISALPIQVFLVLLGLGLVIYILSLPTKPGAAR